MRRSRIKAAVSSATSFEALEGRQMFSSTVPITLPEPTPADLAIDSEYTATANETDASSGRTVQSLLGAATSALTAVPGVSGASMETFQDAGVIYYSPGTGAHVVYGPVGAEYAALAQKTDAQGASVQLAVGLPTGDQAAIAGTSGGRTQSFQAGTIDWSGGTGAHVVYGAIGQAYADQGGPAGWMGFPGRDEYGVGTTRETWFQNGTITCSPTTGVEVHNANVSVVTRFNDELCISAAGLHDIVTVFQNGSTLSIVADGQLLTEPVPAAGLFIYARGGTDQVIVDRSVTVRATIETIDNATTVIDDGDANSSVWCDSTDDVLTSAGPVHRVTSFAGGVSKALGASLPSPSDSGTLVTRNLSLFGKGPVASDINQGNVGDCWFLSALAGLAQQSPTMLLNSAVDMGDRTYVVEFYKAGAPEFVRVDANFGAGPYNGYEYAQPGPNDTIWGAVMEKALAYFRSGDNTYGSIRGGDSVQAFADLNLPSPHESAVQPTADDSAIYAALKTELGAGWVITMMTSAGTQLVTDHVYTLLSVETVNGVHEYTVRNPWGCSGDSYENSQGIATLTYAELADDFNRAMYAEV